ncbi:MULTISPECIES: hypothetical protein [Pseudomonas]|uniref:hypothetical protein n=1 Tax=Pseudomonas TaxID=286 RepID=UPI0030EBBCED
MFAVRSGVDYEDALVHLSTLLKGAFATNLKALELAKGTCRDLLLSNDHGLDSAKAVVEALLDERSPSPSGLRCRTANRMRMTSDLH